MKPIHTLISIYLLFALGCVPQQSSHQDWHIFTLQASAGEPQFEITLPQDFSMQHHEGPDFDVYYFADVSGKSRVGVYVGLQPGLHSKKSGVSQVQHIPGQIGRISIEWLRWVQDGEHNSEALVPGLSGGLILHVFVTADTEQKMVSLEIAASSLRLEAAK
jgi:hypothetical protein